MELRDRTLLRRDLRINLPDCQDEFIAVEMAEYLACLDRVALLYQEIFDSQFPGEREKKEGNV